MGWRSVAAPPSLLPFARGGLVAPAGEAGPRSVGAWTGAARASPAVARVGRRPTADLELDPVHWRRRLRRRNGDFYIARRAPKLRYYGDVIHSFYWKSAVEHDGGKKMRDSVPSPRYSPHCNVLRQWKTSLIPTYRVYRLYDISLCLIIIHVQIMRYIDSFNSALTTVKP